MSKQITMYKPSGVEVVINESSLKQALALGWIKTAPKKTKSKKA